MLCSILLTRTTFPSLPFISRNYSLPAGFQGRVSLTPRRTACTLKMAAYPRFVYVRIRSGYRHPRLMSRLDSAAAAHDVPRGKTR